MTATGIRRPWRWALGAAALLLLVPAPSRAHHMVWLDFSGLDLSAWASVNGNTPPTANDLAQVQALVVANMAQDYAAFDVTLSLFQPANGRYTRVRFLPTTIVTASGTTFGCAGADCCPAGGTCTGISSWDSVAASQAEIYAGSFSGDANFSGANATTARIANALSHTGSHELGHILDLRHCNAADDSVTLGCANTTTASTSDTNATWHIMASGTSWSLTMAQRATRDRFFSVHASRRILHGNFQARNHFSTLGNLDGLLGEADLAYGRFSSPTTTAWYRRLSDGAAFGKPATASTDAGDAGDIFLLGDVSGDGRADLVYGEFVSATQVRWRVRKATSSGTGTFGAATVWREDAGDVGDIFRLADLNDDGRDDLAYGRPLASDTIRWYARLSSGIVFGAWSIWRDDAGDEGDYFFLADGDADGDADLIYGRPVSATQVSWYGRKSNGTGFGDYSTWRDDAGDKGDLFYVGDVSGDSDADLVYGRPAPNSNGLVEWFVRGSTGSSFGVHSSWSSDAGDPGDLFRLGDGDGDGALDLLYGRPAGMTSLTTAPDLSHIHWYGRRSLDAAFGTSTNWAHDAGDEGDVFP